MEKKIGSGSPAFLDLQVDNDIRSGNYNYYPILITENKTIDKSMGYIICYTDSNPIDLSLPDISHYSEITKHKIVKNGANDVNFVFPDPSLNFTLSDNWKEITITAIPDYGFIVDTGSSGGGSSTDTNTKEYSILTASNGGFDDSGTPDVNKDRLVFKSKYGAMAYPFLHDVQDNTGMSHKADPTSQVLDAIPLNSSNINGTAFVYAMRYKPYQKVLIRVARFGINQYHFIEANTGWEVDDGIYLKHFHSAGKDYLIVILDNLSYFMRYQLYEINWYNNTLDLLSQDYISGTHFLQANCDGVLVNYNAEFFKLHFYYIKYASSQYHLEEVVFDIHLNGTPSITQSATWELYSTSNTIHTLDVLSDGYKVKFFFREGDSNLCSATATISTSSAATLENQIYTEAYAAGDGIDVSQSVKVIKDHDDPTKGYILYISGNSTLGTSLAVGRIDLYTPFTMMLPHPYVALNGPGSFLKLIAFNAVKYKNIFMVIWKGEDTTTNNYYMKLTFFTTSIFDPNSVGTDAGGNPIEKHIFRYDLPDTVDPVEIILALHPTDGLAIYMIRWPLNIEPDQFKFCVFGEVVGITAEDIDWASRTIKVKREVELSLPYEIYGDLYYAQVGDFASDETFLGKTTVLNSGIPVIKVFSQTKGETYEK